MKFLVSVFKQIIFAVCIPLLLLPIFQTINWITKYSMNMSRTNSRPIARVQDRLLEIDFINALKCFVSCAEWRGYYFNDRYMSGRPIYMMHWQCCRGLLNFRAKRRTEIDTL